MLPPLVLSLALSQAPSRSDLQRKVVGDFERIGRTAPREDPALDEAAEAIARAALGAPAALAATADAVADAVSEAGAADPSPRAIVVRADAPQAALDAFLGRTDLPAEAANVFGAAFASEAGHAAAVVLLAQRKIQLSPFPRDLPSSGGTPTLCGTFTAALGQPRFFVTQPEGQVIAVDPKPGAAGFCAPIALTAPGRYAVEVLGTGAAGPEVAALFHVDVGSAPRPEPSSASTEEPASVDAARAEILRRVDALRRSEGAAPLVASKELDQVAQDYAEQMAAEHFFAHVAPDGATLGTRLRRHGVSYGRAGENLGLADGPLAAHQGIERSPGHRQNLLDRAFSSLGVGVATEHRDGRDQVVLVEVLAQPASAKTAGADPLAALKASVAHARAADHLPPLRSSEVLDRLALLRAQTAAAMDSVDVPPPEPLEPQVFRAIPEVHRAAVEVFVTSDVGALPPAHALKDVRNDLFGAAVLRGNSRRYGPDKFWAVIICASTR